MGGRFKESCLKTSLQPFPVTTEASLGKGNQLHLSEGGHPETLKCPEEFVPFNFSSSGKMAAQLVFVGYGITAPEYHYDDYTGDEVKRKNVILLRDEPQHHEPKGFFQGKPLSRTAQYANH